MRASWLVVLLVACAHSQGAERGACRDLHACDVGLVCVSDTCVRPPADCREVAAHLVDLRVPQGREALVERCESRRLDLSSLDCLVHARAAGEAAACPGATDEDRVPFWDIPACADVIAHLEAVARGTDVVARVGRRCPKQELPAAELRCYLHAAGAPDVERCAGRRLVAAGAKLDVAACDFYLERMIACAQKMPSDARDAILDSIAAMREVWRDATDTPEGRDALARGCAKAVDAAQDAYRAIDCSFR